MADNFYAKYPVTGGGGGGTITSVNGQTGPVVQLDAVDIPYDNTASGLTATEVQGAIDEIEAQRKLPGRIIYADAVNGLDTNTGSANSPVQTLQKAVTLVVNPLVGYLIRLAPGDYGGAMVEWPANADLQGSGENDTNVSCQVDYTATAGSSTGFNMSMIAMTNITLDFTLAGQALPTFYDGSFKVIRTDSLGSGPWAVRVNDSSMGDCVFGGNNLLSNVLFFSNVAVNSGALYCSDCIIGVEVDITGPASIGLSGCTVPGVLNGIPSGGQNPNIITDAASLLGTTITGTFNPIVLSDKAKYVDYDNTTSGLAAINVQDAIDEVATSAGGSVISMNLVSATYTPADITGATINPATVAGFDIDYIIKRKYTNAELPGGNLNTGFITNSLAAALNGNVRGMFSSSSNTLTVAGDFTQIGSDTVGRIARFDNNGIYDPTFTGPGTGANNTITTVRPNDSSQNDYWIGGDFTTYNGITAVRCAHLDVDGVLDTTFATNLGAGFNANVKSIAYMASSSQVTIAGSFTSFNGNTRNRIVLVNADGTEDAAFATGSGTGFNNQVQCIHRYGSQILCVGNFTSYNGTAVPRIAVLNLNGTLDTTFNTNLGTGANNTVSSVYYDSVNNAILFSGQFSNFNGVSRSALARVSAVGVPDTVFNSHLGNSLSAINTNTVFCNQGATYAFSQSGPIHYYDSMGYENPMFKLTLTGGALQNSYLVGAFSLLVGGSMVAANDFMVNKFVPFSYLSTGNDINLYEKGSLAGYYNDESTNFEYDVVEYIGQESYNTISVASSGQVQYTSPNVIGTEVENSIRLLIKDL